MLRTKKRALHFFLHLCHISSPLHIHPTDKHLVYLCKVKIKQIQRAMLFSASCKLMLKAAELTVNFLFGQQPARSEKLFFFYRPDRAHPNRPQQPTQNPTLQNQNPAHL